jgi:hypothetical protein
MMQENKYTVVILRMKASGAIKIRYCQKFYEKRRRYGTTEFTEKFSVVSML